ncbi:hypothetical protein C8R43DRAFT_956328 [Mycena crocata]|nr:hypothetical protein C8R43DRAFT_956328 [Mycena crocata]
MPGFFGDGYNYENNVARHLPKHWDPAEERVCVWQPNLPTEYPLERLLGAYTFASFFNEDKPYNILMYEDMAFLKLSLRPGTQSAPENVLGVFEVGDDGWVGGTFAGLTPANISGGPPRPTLYRVTLSSSLKNFVRLKDHALEVLDAVDDNGNNYIHIGPIRFGYFDRGSNCRSYMAKKQLGGGQKATLTRAERREGSGYRSHSRRWSFMGGTPGWNRRLRGMRSS